MPNITRPWKRFLICACSHGHLADPSALKAVLQFKRQWKPHTTLHLGDFTDMAALRAGAGGTSDEAESLYVDLCAGTDFLEKLEPRTIFLGNHEHRIPKLANHPNAVIAYACSKIYGTLQDLGKKLRAEVVPYDVEFGWRPLGDMLCGHGYSFNENALRDHAESFGKCCIGHLHVVDQAHGRRLGCPVAYCAGTLANLPAMGYARTRRATLRWSQGFVWGEYCSDEAIVNLYEKPKCGWRLPPVRI